MYNQPDQGVIVSLNNSPVVFKELSAEEIVKARLANNESIAKEMNIVQEYVKQDFEYFWGWHCNLTMAAVDEGVSKPRAMSISRRFLHSLFNIDIGLSERYITEYEDAVKVI